MQRFKQAMQLTGSEFLEAVQYAAKVRACGGRTFIARQGCPVRFAFVLATSLPWPAHRMQSWLPARSHVKEARYGLPFPLGCPWFLNLLFFYPTSPAVLAAGAVAREGGAGPAAADAPLW